MARVDLYVQNSMWQVGEDWFLHSFFSTIAYRLEPEGWGSTFPALMSELYAGRLSAQRLTVAAAELAAVRAELATRPPAERIFAYEDPERPTPWPVPPGATSLADCFVTTSRSNLLDVIDEAIRDAEEAGADVEIRAFPVDDPHVLFATDG